MKTKDIKVKHKLCKCNCYVCGQYIEISENHYCIPLSDVAQIYNEIGYFISENVIYKLCPNHHKIVHKILKNVSMRQMYAILQTLTINEAVKIEEIINAYHEMQKQLMLKQNRGELNS